MRLIEIEQRSIRNDPKGINVGMRREVVVLDVRHVDGFRDTRQLVNIPCEAPGIRVINNTP